MDREKTAQKEMKVVCPQCGKALPIRFLRLEGRLRYSIVCHGCKAKSEVEIQDNI
jgi:transcription elongation factor Elf1